MWVQGIWDLGLRALRVYVFNMLEDFVVKDGFSRGLQVSYVAIAV